MGKFERSSQLAKLAGFPSRIQKSEDKGSLRALVINDAELHQEEKVNHSR